MDHYKGINENERYNNDLLNEIRKTNQLAEEQNNLLKQLISPIKPISPTIKKPAVKKPQTRKKVR